MPIPDPWATLEPAGDVVRAAGGVVWRTAGDDVEVLVIHRERYGDWTLPKGKLDPGESWEQAAVREVWEETGIVPVLGPRIAEVSYTDGKDRPKTVRYWAMQVAVDGGFEPDDEVDEVRWLSPAAATARMTYDRDAEVIETFVSVRPSLGTDRRRT